MEGKFKLEFTPEEFKKLVMEIMKEAYEMFKKDFNDDRYYIGKDEFKEKFECGDATLSKLIYDGLPYAKEGRTYIFLKDSVHEFWKTREQNK